MNAGEQSFNDMPFIIDYSNELIVQLDYNIEKQTKCHIRGNALMEKKTSHINSILSNWLH